MPRHEVIYAEHTKELIQQRGLFPETTEAQPVEFTPDSQLYLLRELGIPIDRRTAGHIFSHYKISGNIIGMLDMRQDAQGELFYEVTLDLFGHALAQARESGAEINPSEMLRSLMVDKESEYDSRFDTPPTPWEIDHTFGSFVYRSLLTDDQADVIKRVWLEPYSEDVVNQIFSTYRDNKAREIDRNQQRSEASQYVDDPTIDFQTVPEPLRGWFLRNNIEKITMETPERAIEIFHQLTGKERLAHIDVIVEALVSIQRSEDAIPLLASTRRFLMNMPLREERLAYNKHLRDQGLHSRQVKRRKDEVTEEDYLALLHPHAFAADLSGMTVIFERLDRENYRELCADMGVTPEQLNALLIQTYAEEEHGRKMGQEWDHYRIGKVLERSYIPREDLRQSPDAVELYSSLVLRRILAFGEEGIGYLPEELLAQRSNVRKIIEKYIDAGNLEAAKPWIQRYHELSSQEVMYDTFTLSSLLDSLMQNNLPVDY